MENTEVGNKISFNFENVFSEKIRKDAKEIADIFHKGTEESKKNASMLFKKKYPEIK